MFASVDWSLTQTITAIGGLGTAAFGLVDATKVFGDFGVNRIGFKRLGKAVAALTPDAGLNSLSRKKILDTLKANWHNGNDLASQKSIAKSLIKLNLNPANAPALARATGMDEAALTVVTTKIASGTTLSPTESDVYGRFDLIVTAFLDEAYQHGDQAYRNGTRAWAVVFSVALAFAGVLILCYPVDVAGWWRDTAEAAVVGLLATPLAPIAKDLSSALATAVNTLQTVKK
ncbi:MAG: hypothetical protein ABSB67_15450 [Bryobacteraceae bacterium]